MAYLTTRNVEGLAPFSPFILRNFKLQVSSPQTYFLGFIVTQFRSSTKSFASMQGMRVSWGVTGLIQPLAFIPGASPDPVFFFVADADYYFFNYNELVRFPSGPFASHDHFLGQLDKQFLSRGTEVQPIDLESHE
ncbi:hypothetical protein B0H17DRAFT_1215700 [Mycena rosella]|uniref:Uncharacterized protein n=1 Tax=Mycena rosella TaxID=1033263 RepID=A0AAD7CH22_MYCRO|nr:hypothetical protein B0H17DRAFT_1215700 [Mycena rosella]